MDDEARYTIGELADLAGVTPRTVRYYVATGLLPSSGRPGPGPRYGDEHLARLRLIRQLKRDHLPLDEIRRRLETGGPVLREASPALATPEPGAALRYVRSALSDVREGTYGDTRGPAPSPAALPSPGIDGPDPASTRMDRSQWERVVLSPDVELHVRRPLERRLRKKVDRLIAIGRELCEEDRP